MKYKAIPEGTEPDSNGVRSVNRASRILALLSRDHMMLGVNETSILTGLPKTTVLRLLQTLEHSRVLWGHGNGRYTPGPMLLQWARTANDAWLFPPEFQGILVDLAQRGNETANVYIRNGLHRVCIAQAPGPQNLRHVVMVGDELPLWAGAASKILLVDALEELVEEILQLSPNDPRSQNEFRLSMMQAAQDGYAVSHAERDTGVSAVSIPISGDDGACIAALSLSGPTSRFSEDRLPGLILELQRAAEMLSRAVIPELRNNHVILSRLKNNHKEGNSTPA